MEIASNCYHHLHWLVFLCILFNFNLSLSQAVKCFYSVKTCKIKSSYDSEKDCSTPKTLGPQEISRELSRDFFMCIKSSAEARKKNGDFILMKLRIGVTEQEYNQEFGYGRGGSSSSQNTGVFRTGTGGGIESVFGVNNKKNKNQKDKYNKCVPFPVKGNVPRKVMDHYSRFSDSTSITNVQACACRANYCNSAKSVNISHLSLVLSACATISMYYYYSFSHFSKSFFLT